MFDAISNFVIYLQECMENTDDPEELARLRGLLEKAQQIKEKMELVKTQKVEA